MRRKSRGRAGISFVLSLDRTILLEMLLARCLDLALEP